MAKLAKRTPTGRIGKDQGGKIDIIGTGGYTSQGSSVVTRINFQIGEYDISLTREEIDELNATIVRHSAIR